MGNSQIATARLRYYFHVGNFEAQYLRKYRAAARSLRPSSLFIDLKSSKTRWQGFDPQEPRHLRSDLEDEGTTCSLALLVNTYV